MSGFLNVLVTNRFSPRLLFAAGEQGAWYDPSDFASLFQDSAGTTPVTAVEQPVGLVLDKSGRGNHASQGTAASRPVLSARVNQFVSTATLATQNVTTVAANYTLRFEGTGSITLSGTASGTYSAGSRTVTCTPGTLTATVTGTVTNADIRVANDGVGLPAYQRIDSGTAGTSTTAGTLTYDTTGFPYYLRFDGTDDGLVTATINPGSVNKAQVFAGVRKLSNSAEGILVEMGSGLAANSFRVYAPRGTNNNYSFRSGGSTFIDMPTATNSFIAPITNVLTCIDDISADYLAIRANGAEVITSAADQGTGNFNSNALYIGDRGGTTIRFNGRLYGLIIRFSATNMSGAEITNTETWLNGKTYAY